MGSITMTAVFGFALAAAPALAGPAVDPVPPEFQGTWNEEREGCGMLVNGTEITITADRIQLYDGSGPITVMSHFPDEKGLIIHADITNQEGGADTASVPFTFFLKADGDELLQEEEDGNRTRYRCPG